MSAPREAARWSPCAPRSQTARRVAGPKDGYGKGYPAAFAANRAKGALRALIVTDLFGWTAQVLERRYEQ
jgi:hypothetical protein